MGILNIVNVQKGERQEDILKVMPSGQERIVAEYVQGHEIRRK